MMSTSKYTSRPMRSFTASMRRETDSRKFMASRSEHSARSCPGAWPNKGRRVLESVRRLEGEVDEERYEQRACHPPGRMDMAPRRGRRLGLGRGSGELLVE